MTLVVRAFPVLEGMEESVREIARTMAGERAGQTAEFFSRLGVRHESWHLQETPAGLWVIAVSDLDAPEERAQEYAASNREFDSLVQGACPRAHRHRSADPAARAADRRDLRLAGAGPAGDL